jgi:hypothetical protein
MLHNGNVLLSMPVAVNHINMKLLLNSVNYVHEIPMTIFWRLESYCYIALDRSKTTSSFVVPCMNGIVEQRLPIASSQTGNPIVTGTRNKECSARTDGRRQQHWAAPCAHQSDLSKDSVKAIDQTGPTFT